ncbi:hypothetical protein DAEQUDRAFT_730074 [Daedalea quercina L-15889]|uniref:Histone deacetylase interacting domain-containing protein n=1 Tax=Daedalea quercina L-15889 TaxID=1314783 RepID=A0A165N8N4_9APHY|nr:hypothetical protein DAEQUDRAFT_730074 [Daedalea quercina L-15889]
MADNGQPGENSAPESRSEPTSLVPDKAETQSQQHAEPTDLPAPQAQVDLSFPEENAAAAPQSMIAERPLNVTDALTYLDSVKLKFQDNPEVYNRFLDIMKDFKSQIIDTPGVIERVSNLFHGHPTLIQGFNTFLPAGYRIDCTTDAQNPNSITVTTPAGITTQTTHGTFAFGGSSTRPDVPPEIERVPVPSPVPDVNLEPALAYIQRVKTRYANEPEKYRRFLEILNPKTGGGVSELRELEHWAVAFLSAGYAQGEVVQRLGKLFSDAPSLMKDFIEFLPDRHMKEVELAKLAELQESRKASTPAGESKSRKKGEGSASGAGSSASAPQKRKRKVVEREKEDKKEKEKEKESTAKTVTSKSKRSRPSHAQGSEAPSPAISQRVAAGPSSPRRQPPAHASQSHGHHSQSGPAMQAAPPMAVAPPVPQPLSPADETQFFDQVKRALDSREAYNEFLKLVNLFTQDIIDSARLVRDVRNFLGDGELTNRFMEILGWDEMRDGIAVADDVWTRPMVALERPSRNQLNIRYGSYRKLPQNEVNVTCSGRDEMCKSVLNDEWISQPTFASEDTGFSTHRKNIYEEALLRSEEERHEYDFYIEAISRTIVMLEPLHNKIAQLSPEERNSFKLKPNLGGAGKSVHLRVLKKIYGREAGIEVYQAMQDVPAFSIPVVLSRLKVKHEEWRRAQREWNKIWREVDARNYHKSLDYQGITFKMTDKKAITTKAFVSQIEAARDEQMAKRAALIDPLFARTRPRHQLEFVVEDIPVLQDALKLTLSFLDRTGGQINAADRKKIETFLRAFVPIFFVLDPAQFNTAFVAHHVSGESDMDVDSTTDDLDPLAIARMGKRKANGVGSGGDLRKKLLKSEQAKSSRRTRAHGTGSPSVSRFASPAASDAMQVDSEDRPPEPTPSSTTAAGPSSPANEKPSRRRYSFFTNTTFYVFFRLLELLYSRLLYYRDLATRIAEDPKAVSRPKHVVTDLGNLRERATNARHFYTLMLESCEKLFDNELEQVVFEDQLRWMFGPQNAYKMFTVDRVVGAIVKQVQNVLSDAKSQELFEFLRRDRELASPTTQDQINARRNTERVVGPDENIFRIDWLPESKTVTVQLFGKDDSRFVDSEALTGRWQAYVQSFVSDERTQGVPARAGSKRPFLRKSRLPTASTNEMPDVVARGSLEIKVCVRTYRLFFVSHTEDYLWRIVGPEELSGAREKARTQSGKRRQWLQQFVGQREEPELKQRKEQGNPAVTPPASDSKNPAEESQPALQSDNEPPSATRDEASRPPGSS